METTQNNKENIKTNINDFGGSIKNIINNKILKEEKQYKPTSINPMFGEGGNRYLI